MKFLTWMRIKCRSAATTQNDLYHRGQTGLRILAVILLALSLSHSSGFALSQSKSVKPKTPTQKKTDKKTATKPGGAKKQGEANSEQTLAAATDRLKADLAAEIAIREINLKKLADELRVEEKKQLFKAGLITKEPIEEAERKLAVARAELEATKQKIVQADNTIAEVKAMEKLTKLPPLRLGAYSATAALIRYNGPSAWTLTNIANVDRFFAAQFGHSLPISAFGQTATHDRLGFDHRNSVDVAVHPDSAEGQAILQFLRNAGIPFLAFRQAVPGAATGAHIHIGYPSHRFIGK